MKDYRDIIIRPVITEKSMKKMAEENKVTFQVAKGVNKVEVRKAVEEEARVFGNGRAWQGECGG